MKRFWKSLAICIALILSLGILAACGGKDMSGSPYCGDWKAIKGEYSGYEFTMQELEMDLTLHLGADGKATADFNGDSNKGTWEETENGVLIKDSSDELEVTDENGILTYVLEDVKFYFEKQ